MSKQNESEIKICFSLLLPEVHGPSVDAYGKVHVVVQLADDVGVLGVGVRGEEPRVGGHAHAGQELVHRIRRLKNARKFTTFTFTISRWSGLDLDMKKALIRLQGYI